MTLIIGASGRARHGKTAACEAIQDYAVKKGLSAELYDIGDMIRRKCIKEGRLPEVSRAAMTPAQLQILIDVGLEYREKRGKTFWIAQIMEHIKEDDTQIALIPNLRFSSEAKAVRSAGGYIVRIVRLNDNGSLYISPDRDANSESESGLDSWPADHVIVSKGGHGALVAQQAITLFCYLQGLHS